MKRSAGLLPFRRSSGHLEVLLAHPGGPFWEKKDEGAWSIVKGEFEDEDPLAAARREFEEETGFRLNGEFLKLTPVKQPSGKVIFPWAVEAQLEAAEVRSNTFSMEWPPKSGRHVDVPEIDRAEWFSMAEARRKMLKGQLPILDELVKLLGAEAESR